MDHITTIEKTRGASREHVDGRELAEGIEHNIIVQDPLRKRSQYFDGRLLTAQDLTRDQQYTLMRQRDIARTMGSGVVTGLEVSLGQNDLWLEISPGFGVTPFGELVVLRPGNANGAVDDTPVTIKLEELETHQHVNAALGLTTQRVETRTRTGLFILALRPVEYARGAVASYPEVLTGDRRLQAGHIVEATAITLIPFDISAPASPALQQQRRVRDRRRARAAAQVFSTGSPDTVTLPVDAVAVAMVSLTRNRVDWIDTHMVRRTVAQDATFAGFGIARPGVMRAFARQYNAHLQDVLTSQNAPDIVHASTFFHLMPPAGVMPSTGVHATVADGQARLQQSYFPPDIDVEITAVPQDELPALVEQAMTLGPLDLSLSADALSTIGIRVLVPVPRESLRQLRQDLDSLSQKLSTTRHLQLRRKRPIAALRSMARLSLVKADAAVEPPTISEEDQHAALVARWKSLLDEFRQAGGVLWYVRERSLAQHTSVVQLDRPATPVDDDNDDDSTDSTTAVIVRVLSKLREEALYKRLIASLGARKTLLNQLIVDMAPQTEQESVLAQSIVRAAMYGLAVEGITPSMSTGQYFNRATEFARASDAGLEQSIEAFIRAADVDVVLDEGAIEILEKSRELGQRARLNLKEMQLLSEQQWRIAAWAGVTDSIVRQLTRGLVDDVANTTWFESLQEVFVADNLAVIRERVKELTRRPQ